MKKSRNIKTIMVGLLLMTGIAFGFMLGKNYSNLSGQKMGISGVLAMYIENEDGGYDLSSQTTFPSDGYVLNTEKSTCRNGGSISQDLRTKKLSVSVSNKDECTVYFDKLTPMDIIRESSNGIKIGFDAVATTDEGVFEMEDDYGTSYYYRGAVENNYVKYGSNALGQEMWWRIIRINGDGSLRIVYDGTQGYENGTSNDDRFVKVNQPYNTNKTDVKYVGWMYGPAGTDASTSKEQAQSNIESSDAKKIVDQWYKENIVDTGYGNNVSDKIFCNDRSTNKTNYQGFGQNKTTFGAYARMKIEFSGHTGAEPTFKCPQKNDAFTVDDTEKGNGALEYPVGLITGDEIIAAGSGKYNVSEGNTKYYLYKSSSYFQWSISPCFWNTYANVFGVYNNGELRNPGVYSSLGAIAPVINLSPEYASSMVGTGTITDPYRRKEA